MKPLRTRITVLPGALLLAAGCATGPGAGPAPVAPKVPASLQAPAGQSVMLEVLASGVQIYECAARADQPAQWERGEWAFRAPEAVLTDRAGRVIGKHYAGPTWESSDGSRVVGELQARDPGPDASAIPWLLLRAKSVTGSGVFSQVKSIQRVATVGGVAPALPCGSGNAQPIARVPYTATYYFYRGEG